MVDHINKREDSHVGAINYRHLRYFWAVVRHGGVTAAGRALHVSQSAVSLQIKKLERAVGHDLFERRGRGLRLTPEGRVAFDYAQQIFSLGRELQDTLAGRLEGRPMRLAVGLSATIPNLVAFHLLSPAFAMPDSLRMVVRESHTDRLLAELATQDLDIVLSDMPLSPHAGVKAFSHALGSSPVEILAPPLLADRVREGFPRSLDGQPFILPTQGYALRRSMEEWLARHGIRPLVFAEVEDNDLINVFSEGGAGVFAAPAVITDDIRVRYAVEVVGRADGVSERYYAISAERRLRHPAVVAITQAARSELAALE